MISATAFRRGRVHANMLVEIEHFLRANPLGTVVGTTGVRIGESPDSVREVASTYWSKEKIPLGEEVIGYPPMPPDLVIEILSSSSNFAQMRETIREYFTSGIHIVWVIDPPRRQGTSYREPGKGTVLWEDETLTGEDVLPGFACVVSQLFQ